MEWYHFVVRRYIVVSPPPPKKDDETPWGWIFAAIMLIFFCILAAIASK